MSWTPRRFASLSRETGHDLLRLVAVSAAIAALAAPAMGQGERRQLGAHQHGRGSVNIAIDGPRLVIELDVPGADIVGFEHAPVGADEKAAAERALAWLRDPLSLFVIPAAARCRVDETNVELEQAEQAQAGQHADYTAEYALTCAAPAALTSI